MIVQIIYRIEILRFGENFEWGRGGGWGPGGQKKKVEMRFLSVSHTSRHLVSRMTVKGSCLLTFVVVVVRVRAKNFD